LRKQSRELLLAALVIPIAPAFAAALMLAKGTDMLIGLAVGLIAGAVVGFLGGLVVAARAEDDAASGH
jgi:ABC-type uncharacterized transport system permease subunit